jgi:hypothetical protein
VFFDVEPDDSGGRLAVGLPDVREVGSVGCDLDLLLGPVGVVEFERD